MFFQIPFRNTHHAVRITNRLALFCIIDPSRTRRGRAKGTQALPAVRSAPLTIFDFCVAVLIFDLPLPFTIHHSRSTIPLVIWILYSINCSLSSEIFSYLVLRCAYCVCPMAWMGRSVNAFVRRRQPLSLIPAQAGLVRREWGAEQAQNQDPVGKNTLITQFLTHSIGLTGQTNNIVSSWDFS